METVIRDLRQAARGLRNAPGFAAIAILTLALGIGATTAIFSVVDAALLRPLPYPDEDRVVAVQEQNLAAGLPQFSVSPPNYDDWVRESRSFAHLAAIDFNSYNLTGDGEPERLQGHAVTASYWGVLGRQPVIGRVFTPDEDRPGAGKVVVVSHGLWQRRFGGDPRVVGKSLTLNGEPHVVVGVMPADLKLTTQSPELWVPLAMEVDPVDRGAHWLGVLGRLRDGVTLERASAEMKLIAQRLERAYPDSNTDWTVVLLPLRDALTGEVRPALLVLLAAVTFVLLIACANVSNLLLARAAVREREVALRRALGAGRGRLIRQLLVESLLLAAVGGALGVLLALVATRGLTALLPANLVGGAGLGVDARVLAFAAVLTVVTAIVFGLAPAIRVSSPNLNDALREGGRGGSVGLRRRPWRSLLVVAEIALALVLLVGAGLLIRSFARLSGVDPGFDPAGVLTMQVSLPEAAYAEEAQQVALYDGVLTRVHALPGVEAASLAFPLPLGPGGFVLKFQPEGKPFTSVPEMPAANVRVTGPGFFGTLKVPLLRGRTFEAGDTEASRPVVVVNRAMARQIWPGEDPIGKRLTFDDPREADAEWNEVVGVVGDIRGNGVEGAPPAEVYWPYTQGPLPNVTLVVRTRGDPSALAPAVRAEVRAADPALPVFNVKTLETVVRESVADRRLNVLLLALFAGLALLLSAVGVYGVMSYSVTQRTTEMGVRMALGARRAAVLRLVLRQGMALTVAGVALGALGAFALTRLMASLLYDVGTRDPFTFASVSALLGGVALAACVVPGLRATRVDPIVALRYE